jgi:hypothetical protein
MNVLPILPVYGLPIIPAVHRGLPFLMLINHDPPSLCET